MPVPRKAAIARRGLDADRLHQLIYGVPIPVRATSAWGLPWKWADDERDAKLANMRQVYEQYRGEVIATCKAKHPDRLPWAFSKFEAKGAVNACST